MTSMTVHPPIKSPVNAPLRPAAAKAVMSPWVWMTISCLLLGISGGFRYWREWQFSSITRKGEATPFPLAQLPRTAATWQASEGSDVQLDLDVARIAGSSDHTVRSYLDEKTGEQASVLLLYGPAAGVFGHTPEVCYPAAGYQRIKGPIDDSIAVPGVKDPVRYRWAIYMKRIGGVNHYEEAYYTFRHNGEWMPDVSARWKLFRYHPGLFKVQIVHPVSSLSETGDGPCQPLIAELVRQIESRLSAEGHARTDTPAPAPPEPGQKVPG